jgi:hypothetical protein
MTKAPTWFEVARRPRWIGALALSLLIAAICGFFAQWQGTRSFEAGLPKISSLKTQPLSSVLAPNQAIGAEGVGSKVHVALKIDTGHCYVITNRVQRNGTSGSWVVCKGTTKSNAAIPVALGFSETVGGAKQGLRLLKQAGSYSSHFTGLLAPSEAPQEIPQNLARAGYVLPSLSVGQLINLYSIDAPIRAYPLFLLVINQAAPGLEKITVTTATESQINWLSAFYALEWAVFCGFSVFLWWRLVRDAQIKESNGDSGLGADPVSGPDAEPSSGA